MDQVYLNSSKEVEFHQNIMRTYNNYEKLAYVMDRFYTVGAILEIKKIC